MQHSLTECLSCSKIGQTETLEKDDQPGYQLGNEAFLYSHDEPSCHGVGGTCFVPDCKTNIMGTKGVKKKMVDINDSALFSFPNWSA
jgi:hypothetical protein